MPSRPQPEALDLATLNTMPDAGAGETLRAVCASEAWVEAVLARRPFVDAGALYAAADRAVDDLDASALDEALAGHPRIGATPTGASSRREQSGVAGADDDVKAALVAANAAYEERFGHVYLVCASGRSGAELLEVARQRLDNDPVAERLIVRTELAKINRLRLERLVQGEAP